MFKTINEYKQWAIHVWGNRDNRMLKRFVNICLIDAQNRKQLLGTLMKINKEEPMFKRHLIKGLTYPYVHGSTFGLVVYVEQNITIPITWMDIIKYSQLYVRKYNGDKDNELD